MNPASGVASWATDYLARLEPYWQLGQSLWATDNTRYAVILLGVAALLFVVMPGRQGQQPRANAAPAKPHALAKLPPVGRLPWFRRPFEHYALPLQVGEATIEGYEQHVGFAATTGAFKTTTMAYLLRQSKRPCVVLVGGTAKQLELEVRARGGYVWRPREGVPLYAFPGDPDYCAQAWETLFIPSTGDVGVLRAAFRKGATAYFTAADDAYVPRNLPGLIDHIGQAEGGRLTEAMKESWLLRLGSIQAVLGSSIGNDLDLLRALNAGVDVMFCLDSLDDPSMIDGLSALCFRLIVYAVTRRGRFDFFCDELGRLPKGFLSQALRTFRYHQVFLRSASQSGGDFDEVLRDLVGVWIFGRLTGGGYETRMWASRATFGTIPPENFGAHALERRHFYVVADGRVQDVEVPAYSEPAYCRGVPARLSPGWEPDSVIPPSLQPRAVLAGQLAALMAAPTAPTDHARTNTDADTGEAESEGLSEAEEYLDLVKHQPQRIGPIPIPEWTSGRRLKADQRDRQRLEEIWAAHVFPYGVDGCYETTYSVNQEGANGRPRCGYMGQSWLVYALVLAVQDGLDLDVVREEMKTRKRSADHCCENNRCVRVEHLRWLDSTGANSAAYHERRRETLRLLTSAAG